MNDQAHKTAIDSALTQLNDAMLAAKKNGLVVTPSITKKLLSDYVYTGNNTNAQLGFDLKVKLHRVIK